MAWYFGVVPTSMWQKSVTTVWFIYHLFSIARLTRTLFQPWKKLYTIRTKPGLDLTEIVNVWSFNVISRIIGTLVRFHTIVFGWVMIVLAVVSWLVIAVGWFFGSLLLPIIVLWYGFVQALRPKVPLQHFQHSPAALAEWLGKQPFFYRICMLLDVQNNMTEGLACIAAQSSLGITFTASHASLTPEALVLDICQQLGQQDWWQHWLQSQHCLSEDYTEVLVWQQRELQAAYTRADNWNRDNLLRVKTIGSDWGFGYTPTLDHYAEDMVLASTAELDRNVWPDVLLEIERLFTKERKTNILLVGEPGVGKHMMAYFLAKSIADGKTIPELADHRVMELNMDEIIADGRDQAQSIKLLSLVVAEAMCAGNIILVINNFDRYVSADQHNVDVSRVFERIKDTNRIKLLAIVTTSHFSTKIATNHRLTNAMEVIHLAETKPAQTLRIMQSLADYHEARTGVMTQLPALMEMIRKGDEVVTNVPFPEKGVTILDDCVSEAQAKGVHIINRELVDRVLSERTGIPVGIWDEEYRQKVSSISKYLHERVIGQEPAIQAISQAIKRAAVGLGARDKTVGSLLFLGTTGVGKTESAKALAELFFGSEDALIRIDCGEYNEPASVRNLIGAPEGADADQRSGQLTEAVRQQPYSVVLFDEIEKAHHDILNAIMTIFDEGYLTDARGEKISFRSTIVIATSNAASELIKQLLIDRRQTVEQATPQVIDTLIRDRVFRPEFINRFDSVVLYKPLSKLEMVEIARLKLQAIITDIGDEHGIYVTFTDDYLHKLVEQGYSEQFGARYLERTLMTQVTDEVTELLLSKKVQRGETVNLH